MALQCIEQLQRHQGPDVLPEAAGGVLGVMPAEKGWEIGVYHRNAEELQPSQNPQVLLMTQDTRGGSWLGELCPSCWGWTLPGETQQHSKPPHWYARGKACPLVPCPSARTCSHRPSALLAGAPRCGGRWAHQRVHGGVAMGQGGGGEVRALLGTARFAVSGVAAVP